MDLVFGCRHVLLTVQNYTSDDAPLLTGILGEEKAAWYKIIGKNDLRRTVPVEMIPQEPHQLMPRGFVGDRFLQIAPAVENEVWAVALLLRKTVPLPRSVFRSALGDKAHRFLQRDDHSFSSPVEFVVAQIVDPVKCNVQ